MALCSSILIIIFSARSWQGGEGGVRVGGSSTEVEVFEENVRKMAIKQKNDQTKRARD